MVTFKALKTVWTRLRLILICGWLSVGLVSCGNRTVTETPQADRLIANPRGSQTIQVVKPPEVIAELSPWLDDYQPQVTLVSPKPDEILQDTSVSVRFDVKDLPIYEDETWGLGPHLHVILDNEPYRPVYDLNKPLVLSDLSAGTHTLRVFAARPWYESFKNAGAYAQVTFHVFTKTHENMPKQGEPLLTYSHPEGTYGAEPIMLDFYLTEAPLHMVTQENSMLPDWRVRYTVNGQSIVSDTWEPVYLQGFKPGRNWVQLELIDVAGNPIANRFNNTARLITYQPGGEDSLSKLVRGQVSIAEVGHIVDPDYVPPVPEPKPEPEIAPSLEAKPEPEIAPSPAPQPDLGIEPKIEAEPKPAPESELEIAPKVEVEPKVEAKPEPEIIAPEPEVAPKAETAPELGKPQPEVNLESPASEAAPAEIQPSASAIPDTTEASPSQVAPSEVELPSELQQSQPAEALEPIESDTEPTSPNALIEKANKAVRRLFKRLQRDRTQPTPSVPPVPTSPYPVPLEPQDMAKPTETLPEQNDSTVLKSLTESEQGDLQPDQEQMPDIVDVLEQAAPENGSETEPENALERPTKDSLEQSGANAIQEEQTILDETAQPAKTDLSPLTGVPPSPAPPSLAPQSTEQVPSNPNNLWQRFREYRQRSLETQGIRQVPDRPEPTVMPESSELPDVSTEASRSPEQTQPETAPESTEAGTSSEPPTETAPESTEVGTSSEPSSDGP